MPRFTKYETNGAYHWRQYARGDKYRTHVDFLRGWVKEKKLLDVGAGDGLITYLLRADGVDNEDCAVQIAQTIGVPVEKGDAYNLSKYRNYDAVLMIDVLEHFETPEIALREAKQVAPVLYIATPERQPHRRIRDKFHVQEWTRDELVELMWKNEYKLTGDMHFATKGDTMYARFQI